MPEDAHRFQVTATWSLAAKTGTLASSDGSLKLTHGGAASLGGTAGLANPEELLVAAVSTCFLQTWAIFLEKLKVPIAEPSLDGSALVEKDPAGGFRVSSIELAPQVPRALYESRRADVDKTLSLAEKYCIVSKAVRNGLTLTISPRVS